MAPVGALAYGSSRRDDTLIVGDTGGTTFDVSLVRDRRIPRTRETWLGKPFVSHMTGMPSVDVRSIGAGGGSIAWVDERRPACMSARSAPARFPGPPPTARRRPPDRHRRRAGPRLRRSRFFPWRADGARRAAARDALQREVAGRSAKSLEEAAIAVIELATENMVQAIMDITVNQGVDPTETAFVAGGGAGGLDCVAIARRLGCRRVLVSRSPARRWRRPARSFPI